MALYQDQYGRFWTDGSDELGAAKRKLKKPQTKRTAQGLKGFATQNVAVFSFKWSNVAPNTWYNNDGINIDVWGQAFPAAYNRFRAQIESEFPKLLHQGVFTSFAKAGWYNTSWISATGETLFAESVTRQKIIDIARNAGFTGSNADIEFSYKTVQQLKSGDHLKKEKSNIDQSRLDRDKKITKAIENKGAAGIVLEQASKGLLGDNIKIPLPGRDFEIPQIYVLALAAIGVLVILKD